MKYQTKSEKDTRELGKKYAQGWKKNKVFLLIGELGGGKTQFVKGLAEGLGITEPITSPTFTYEKIYENKNGPSLHHFDLYRGDELATDIAALIKESIEEGNVVAIEWAEKAKDIWPSSALRLSFSWKNENEREIIVNEI